MVSLTGINVRLASVQTGFTSIQIKIDKVYPLLLSPSTLRKIFEYIKRGMAQLPHLTLSNNPIKTYEVIMNYSG